MKAAINSQWNIFNGLSIVGAALYNSYSARPQLASNQSVEKVAQMGSAVIAQTAPLMSGVHNALEVYVPSAQTIATGANGIMEGTALTLRNVAVGAANVVGTTAAGLGTCPVVEGATGAASGAFSAAQSAFGYAWTNLTWAGQVGLAIAGVSTIAYLGYKYLNGNGIHITNNNNNNNTINVNFEPKPGLKVTKMVEKDGHVTFKVEEEKVPYTELTDDQLQEQIDKLLAQQLQARQKKT